MRVVSVGEGYEKAFWDLVNKDPVDYYFFVLDWTQRKEQTKILLAVDEKEVVRGAVLVYADSVVQFRGSREAVEKLMEHVNLDKVELQAPLDCEDIVLQKFKLRIRQEMVLMRLNREEERIRISEVPVKLGVEDAEEVADLMRRCDPEWWGETKPENLMKSLETAFFLGIKKDGKLVSAGSARFADFATNIHMVATDERYRNRGYATSIVSALVKEIFRHSPVALIHVIADNSPAVRAYSKVGYKPYKRYLSIRS